MCSSDLPTTEAPTTEAPTTEAAAQGPEHPRCDPSLRKCVVQRPIAFDAFRHAEMAPEMTLLAKRRVSRLFVVPPSTSARRAVLFALWLLSAVDPQGAVVLTAKTADGYITLGKALDDAQHRHDPAVWGNVFVAPVSFVSPSGQEKQEPPVVLWHLSGLDAAEERYEPDTIVLLSAPPRMKVVGDASFLCDTRTFSNRTNRGLVRVEAAVSTESGARVYEALRRTAWRFWFVKVSDEESHEWRLGHDANAAGGAHMRIETVADLLAARGVMRPLFRSPERLVSHMARTRTRCRQRQFEGVVVNIVPGKPPHLSLHPRTFVDNALNHLTRNPQWGLVLVTSHDSGKIAGYGSELAPFYRANIRVRSEWGERVLCRELQENQVLDFQFKGTAPCLGAMTVAGLDAFSVRPQGTVVLMPLIDSQIFGGNLTAAMQRNFSRDSVAHPSAADAKVITVPVANVRPDLSDDFSGTVDLCTAIVANATKIGVAFYHRSLVADILRLGPTSPTARRRPRWAERPRTPWPAADVHAVLDRAEAMGAVVVWPTNILRAPASSPWRYHVTRRRVDPASVRALDPYDKAKLWCDMVTLEGCAPSLVDSARKSSHCKHDNKMDARRLRIKCDARHDLRVLKKHVRPLLLRQLMPSVLHRNASAATVLNMTRQQLAETETERDASNGAATGPTSRIPVDVLVSLISREGKGVDPIEQAESWLEFCPTCVLVYDLGKGDPGALYDLLKAHLAHDVFDRVIVNPKLGMGDPIDPPLLERHVHNIEYARCFVAPLRVIMVADNQAPIRSGMAEYMLAHSSYDIRDLSALVAESDEDEAWFDMWTRSTSPRLMQAAQDFVYGSWYAPISWLPFGYYYCTGKAFFRQTRTGVSSGLGFEGIWFTGAQWQAIAATYRVRHRVHGQGSREHVFLQALMFEDQLRHAYGASPRVSPADPGNSAWALASSVKPLGRNTCLLAQLRRVGPIPLDGLVDALRHRAQGYHFTVKRVGMGCGNPGRRYLRLHRKQQLGLPLTPCNATLPKGL